MRRRLLEGGVLSLALLVAPVMAHAQSAIIYGSLGNFDISNDTGKICHGFEIELGGLTASDIVGSFSANSALLSDEVVPMSMSASSQGAL